MFSLHSLGDTYQESYQEPYQSYEVIRYDKEYGPWPSSRRCGYIYDSFWKNGHFYAYRGTTNGGDTDVGSSANPKYVDCPIRHGPVAYSAYWDNYSAQCDNGTTGNWWDWARQNTCPKGWGQGFAIASSNADEKVQASQGWVRDYITKPVYGYVTRYETKYRTAYYAYISTRVAKA